MGLPFNFVVAAHNHLNNTYLRKLVANAPANGNVLAWDGGAVGKRFATGIGLAITGAAVATDTTAFVAGMQISGTYV